MGTLLSPSQKCHPFTPSHLAHDLVVSPNKRFRSFEFTPTNPIDIEFNKELRNVRKIESISSEINIKPEKEGISLLTITNLRIEKFSSQSFLLSFKDRGPVIRSVKIGGDAILKRLIVGTGTLFLLIACSWLFTFMFRLGLFGRILLQIRNYNRWICENLWNIERVTQDLKEKQPQENRQVLSLISDGNMRELINRFPQIFSELNPPYIYNTKQNLLKVMLLLGMGFMADLIAILLIV
jgi:hypothetical protein